MTICGENFVRFCFFVSQVQRRVYKVGVEISQENLVLFQVVKEFFFKSVKIGQSSRRSSVAANFVLQFLLGPPCNYQRDDFMTLFLQRLLSTVPTLYRRWPSSSSGRSWCRWLGGLSCVRQSAVLRSVVVLVPVTTRDEFCHTRRSTHASLCCRDSSGNWMPNQPGGGR